jgi:UTP--glucose-1-phosphate uridylyltransferase
MNAEFITDPSIKKNYLAWWKTLPLSETERESLSQNLSAYIQKLRLNNSPDLLIWTVCQMIATHFIQHENWIPESEIDALQEGDVLSLDTLPNTLEAIGKSAAKQLAVLKLNGGLGTTMGCSGPKSLIHVNGTDTFLDMISKQMHTLRRQTGHSIPLILLNSFNTSDATLSHLSDMPFLELFQHEVPRIDTETGKPYVCHRDKNLEWYPPGHGDLYLSLLTSGMLDKLIAKGIRYLFVSNADNLGATANLKLLGHMHTNGIPFMMEVTPKTMADIKGGTLIRHKNRVCLLERAQVSPDFLDTFEDINRFTVFNTNSVWINLEVLKKTLQKGPLQLPVIVNPKQVHGTHVIQLEQALGAAIAAFSGAIAVTVSRDRFIPVKATSDLLLLQSDYYTKHQDGRLTPTAPTAPTIILSKNFSKMADYQQRIVYPPSLKKCTYLRLDGDITILDHVKFEGHVHVHVPAGQHVVLEKKTYKACRLNIDKYGQIQETPWTPNTDLDAPISQTTHPHASAQESRL